MRLRIGCVVVVFSSLALAPVPLTAAQTSAQATSALPGLVRFNGPAKDLNGNPMTRVNVTADSNGRQIVSPDATKLGGLPGKNAATPENAPTLTFIAIIPAANGGFGTSNGILPLGTEVPFFATGFYSDNSTKNLTTSVTWASSVPSVARIGVSTGLAIGESAGTTNITAALSGVTSVATPVTVAAGTLQGVAITPATAGVTAGATMQLVAYGNYNVPGATNPWPTVLADLTHEVSWTSSNPSVATVSASGVVKGIAAGTVTITVTMSGFTGTTETASLTVVPAHPKWALTGNLFHQRAGQSAALLHNGTVLLAGGEDSSTEEDSSNPVLDLAEIYSPSTGLFTLTTSNMVDHRTLATATLLPNATVLIAGGGITPGGGGPEDTAEIYNPTTGTFTATANDMSADRSSPTATLLKTGMVLIAGGDGGGTSADLYDPATQTFTPTGPLNVAREYATATLLASGDVLVVGGRDPSAGTGAALSSAELYNPSTGSFTLLTATLAFPRELHTATLLKDGQVLIAGGTSSLESASTPPAYEELYDPTTQTFLPTGALNGPRFAHNALLLGDGMVLLVGGGAPNNLTGLFGQSFPPQATCELYNHATGKFAFTASMSFPRAEFTATLLQNGSVLAAGGEGDILYPAPAEIYTPPSFTIQASPTSVTVVQGNSGTSTITTAVSDGFDSAIALSATGQPTGVTATFKPTSIAAPGDGTSTLTLAVASTTANGTYTITVAGVGGGEKKTGTLTLIVEAAP